MGIRTLMERRNGTYTYRKRVPRDLQEILGRKVIKRSLGTSDPKEAKLRYGAVDAEIMDLFEQNRNKSRSFSPPKQTDALKGEHLRHAEDVLMAMMPKSWLGPKQRVLYGTSSPRNLDENVLNRVKVRIEREFKIPLQKRSQFLTIIEEIRKAVLNEMYDIDKVTHMLDGALHGPQQLPTTGTPNLNANTKGSNKTINDMFQLWAESKRRTSKNAKSAEVGIGRYRQKINLFIEYNGNLPIGEITYDHLLEFRDNLAKATKHKAKTINGYLKAIQAIVSYAYNERYVRNHPFKGAKFALPENDSEKYIPFSNDDLKLLFETKSFSILKASNPAHYWIPLIALYTGARLEEIGQLKQKDIAKTKGGLFYFDINEKDSDKKLKTKSSIRKIPIHPILIKLGLLDFIYGDKSGSDFFIFPNLVPIENRRTHSVSKWFGGYKRQCGIDDPLKVFHSFRHTLKDACRSAGVPEDMHQQLTGHSNHNVGRRYGYGHSIESLYTEICKVGYAIKIQQK